MKKLVFTLPLLFTMTAFANSGKVESAADVTPQMIKTLPERELCRVLVNKESTEEQVLLAFEELTHRDVNPTLCRSFLTPAES